jgi:hypothetical protein
MTMHTRKTIPLAIVRAIAGAVVSSGCQTQSPPTAAATQPVIVLKDGQDPASAVGYRVRVEGVITASKQPYIDGVDVQMPLRRIAGTDQDQVDDLRNQPAWAEGVLIRHVVTPDEVDNFTQNRGAGTFYSLIDPFTGNLAMAHRAKP